MKTAILIVDDEPACRDSMRLLLLSEGYSVETAATFDRALAVTSEISIDLLLVDWMLKDRCDGLEVARRLREITPDLRVLLTTGYSLDKVRAATRSDDGAIGFLSKPFTPESLTEAVRRSLNDADKKSDD